MGRGNGAPRDYVRAANGGSLPAVGFRSATAQAANTVPCAGPWPAVQRAPTIERAIEGSGYRPR